VGSANPGGHKRRPYPDGGYSPPRHSASIKTPVLSTREELMKLFLRVVYLLSFAFSFLSAPTASAQASKAEMKPPTATVTLVRVAPGKHLEFLKWVAENEAIAKEAGVPSPQIYEHTNGDSWDFMQVGPTLTDAQQAKVDEITKKHGRKTGLGASLEFRTMIAWHTDTMAIGPVTAADLVAAAGK
jgi:hypothetical protein